FILSTIAAFTCSAAPTFTVDASRSAGQVSPRLYGLMTEEINHSYDGGLYAELIRNRNFRDDNKIPMHWSVVSGNGAEASIALDTTNSFNDQLTTSLRLTVTKAAKDQAAGVANSGYWGIPVNPSTKYRASILARAAGNFSGPVTVSIVGDDGKVYASEKFSKLTTAWKKFEVTLKTGSVAPTTKAHFAITMDRPGTVWLGLVSLFPPTWNNRPNGLRKDLMQMMVDMNPKFLRFPGGNYVEGDTIETRFDWKKTIGPIEQRPGHPCPWGYRSTDGLGLLEFLEWCEDMKAEPVLAVYAGYSLKGMHVNPGADLEPFVQDALDEIEYVTGDAKTTWGARRIKDGHPAPFPLKYVEVGNEDWFDKSKSYDARYVQFYKAIKAKYPQLKLISTIGNDQPEAMRVHSMQPDMTDEHYYRSANEFIHMSPDYAHQYDRQGPEIFVGEWAAYETPFVPWDNRSRNEAPTPNLKAAIGDAAFMTAMERNSDLIKMQCYAPMLVNVNPGARQWRPNLIGYDAISSYGSPSYYAIEMFSRNVGDQILSLAGENIGLQGSATRDSRTGELFIKLINPQDTEQAVSIHINGVTSLASKGTAITLAGNPDDTNSITQPKKVVPVTTTVANVQPEFTYTVPAHAIVVLKLKGR
ncbi:MAG TPA: alpha-L-arabinofuranosidase C-terminal domain-containing protein, partial [Verrucomicrobiae bacterium]|nr:alpha-L-arabinofuranosidase C-terminal domain-containing protein [Verrucomicrobiae bacterium]